MLIQSDMGHSNSDSAKCKSLQIHPNLRIGTPVLNRLCCAFCSAAFGCAVTVEGRVSFVSLLSLVSFVSFLRPYLAGKARHCMALLATTTETIRLPLAAVGSRFLLDSLFDPYLAILKH